MPGKGGFRPNPVIDQVFDGVAGLPVVATAAVVP
jgi:hypothetical protein